MCGLAGFLEFASPFASLDDLLSMQRAIRHRGPDDIGHRFEPGVGICHARLAIIDLSSKAHQPMRRGFLTLVYNGEIYNFMELRNELQKLGHRFESQSDTEVLLEGYRAWGKDLLSRLNGMFAFAIYDSQNRTLFLARDRVGIKPLFYYHDSSRFVFGSEIKAIMSYPYFRRKLSCAGLNEYLRFGYTAGEQTIFEGCLRLLPGQYLMVHRNGKKLEVNTYWEPHFENDDSLDFGRAKEKLKEVLIDEFQRSLISNVPFGACISGGVDSNVLIALLSQEIGVKLNTFSLSSFHARFDENAKAQGVANYFKISHTSLLLDPGSAIDMLLDTIVHYDEPIADSNILSFRHIAREARKNGISVLLSGMGGDELFHGYPDPSRATRMETFFYLPYALRKTVPRNLFRFSNAFYKVIHLLQQKTYASAVANLVGRCFFDDEIDDLLGASKTGESCFDALLSKVGLPRDERIREIVLAEFKRYLPDNGLRIADMSCMAEGVEMRVPYLNNAVLDFAFKVPVSLQRSKGQLKVLLRAIESDYLPQTFVIPGKKGFDPFPKKLWLDQHLGQLIDQYFSKERILAQGILDFDTVQRTLFFHKKTSVNVSDKLWNLLVFQIWSAKYL
jgi:asparagine synthase (glutamine-hydrolysing)